MSQVTQASAVQRTTSADAPLISVVVVNYNCMRWLDRFFPSIEQQTIFDRVEIILVDNTSTDGSDAVCREKMSGWKNGVFHATGGNFGFGGGGNHGAKIARGKYLLFLNPDVWLEKDCLEKLWLEAEKAGINVGCPLVYDYETRDIQVIGGSGFDIFGCAIPLRKPNDQIIRRLFTVGTFFFINREFFDKVGGFDDEFFLYCEETDLSWRSQIAGEPVMSIGSARLHHQGASAGDRTVENRTNDTRRFYANRNQLLTILKNAHGPLLLLFFTQLLLMAGESLAGAVASRRSSFINWSFFKPVAACWRMRHHVFAQRRRIRSFRRRGDFWITVNYFQFKFGRWADLERLLKWGIKIDPARK